MKYFSDMTKKVYDTIQELEEAETEVLEQQEEKEKKLAERGERAKRVEEAYKLAAEKREEADKLLNDFLKDYGSYHTTIKNPLKNSFSMFDALDVFFDIFS